MRREGDREIKATPGHVSQQRTGRVLGRVQHHRGYLGGAFSEQALCETVARGRGDSEGQAPGAGSVALAHLPDDRVGLLEQFAPALAQQLASRRYLNSTPDPGHQLDPELPLELLDRRAQRRLGNVEPFGGAGHVSLLSDGHEIANQPQVRRHRTSLCDTRQPVLDAATSATDTCRAVNRIRRPQCPRQSPAMSSRRRSTQAR